MKVKDKSFGLGAGSLEAANAGAAISPLGPARVTLSEPRSRGNAQRVPRIFLAAFASFAVALIVTACANPVAGPSNAISKAVAGSTWKSASLPAAAYWTSVAYGNGDFVAVASGGSQSGYSTDGGMTWTSMPLPASQHWWSVAFGGRTFVAIALENSNGTATTKAPTRRTTERPGRVRYYLQCVFGVPWGTETPQRRPPIHSRRSPFPAKVQFQHPLLVS